MKKSAISLFSSNTDTHMQNSSEPLPAHTMALDTCGSLVGLIGGQQSPEGPKTTISTNKHEKINARAHTHTHKHMDESWPVAGARHSNDIYGIALGLTSISSAKAP
jgi:hypothetical protein